MDNLDLHPAFSQTDISSVRAIVATEIKLRNDHPYAWCLSATVTTDQFVKEFLDNWQQSILFNPGLLVVNLRVAGDLLDKALSRKGEITGLEERSISAFLDYHLAESVQPIQLKLAKLSLKATRKIAVAGVGEADESTLVAQDQAQTSARQLRLLLHRAPGHPLNFGERIDNLRLLLCDSIVSIYERLKAIRIGMAHFGIFRAATIPVWDGSSPRNLLNLVEWLREAIRSYEASANVRIEYVRNIYLGADSVVTGGAAAIQAEMALDRDHDIDFFLDTGKVSHVFAHSIISDFSVSLAFKENAADLQASLSSPPNADARSSFSISDSWLRRFREQYSMTCLVRPPMQVTSLSGGDVTQWSRPPLALVDIPAWWSGTFRPNGIDPQAMSGLNPIGAWSLNMDRNLRNSDGGLSSTATLSPAANAAPLQICDLVLSLKLQSWR